jgi:hypothetical protein
MSNTYGMEVPGGHAGAPHRAPARYLVVIDGPEGTKIARLFSERREPAGEFDAGTDDVVRLTRGLTPVHGASGREWDAALAGHSAAERLAAAVYTLAL